MTASFCSWCGKPDADVAHDLCQRRLALVDPPRYCAQCARRMVVQVTPAGWVAKCSRHGEISSAR